MVTDKSRQTTDEVKRLKHKLCRIFEDQFDSKGMNPLFGTLYSMFITAEQPLLQKDIAEEAGVSVSSVSRALKVLTEKWQIVERSRVPASREWHYKTKASTFVDMYFASMDATIIPLRVLVDRIAALHAEWESLPADVRESKDGAFLGSRLQELKTWGDFLFEEFSEFIGRMKARFAAAKAGSLMDKN